MNTFVSEGSIEKKLLGDDGQLSVLRKDIGSCEHSKSYVLTSKTEKQRHTAAFRRRQVQNVNFFI